MNYKIEMITAPYGAYMRHVGAYGQENYALMEQFKIWAKKQDLLTEDATIYAVARDNPQTTQPEECRYDVGMAVHSDFHDVAVSLGTLFDGGKYLVFQIEHTAEAVQNFWANLFPILQNEGFHFDQSRLVVERYCVRFVEQGFCEMCVPILD